MHGIQLAYFTPDVLILTFTTQVRCGRACLGYLQSAFTVLLIITLTVIGTIWLKILLMDELARLHNLDFFATRPYRVLDVYALAERVY